VKCLISNLKERNMNSTKYPSTLTTFVIKDKDSEYPVLLPKNERFRIANIFKQHEYQVPRQFLPPKPITVVDVGANVGLFALYMNMAASTHVIHCFEPAPATVKLLRRNLGALNHVRIHPFGLTDYNGTAVMTLDPTNTGGNSISRSPGEKKCVEVSVHDASAVLDRYGLADIDILKIDTEGSEVPILASLSSRLNSIGIVMLEYHSERDRREIDRLLSQFKLFGSNSSTLGVGTVKYINKRYLC
jgi:FkbM family methyltransferase